MSAERGIPSRGTLLVVGTGIQWGGQMTLAARNAVRDADRVLFAVTDPWAVRWLRSLNPNAESLPYPRDGRPRLAIYRAMTERILESLRDAKRVCAAFYGSPTFLVRAARDAVSAAKRSGYQARVLPGISSLECMAADLELDLGEAGYQLFEAGDFLTRPRQVDPNGYLILCQVALIGQRSAFDGDERRIRRGLGLLAARISEIFGPRHRALVYEAALHPLGQPTIREIEVGLLASAPVSEVSTLCVPPLGRAPLDHRVAGLLAAPFQESKISNPAPSALRLESTHAY